MPDRIIRDELLESDRWLDLPTDAARVAFVGFLLICDDFGNFEGGPRRIFRFIHRFTQVKTEGAVGELLGSLIECDLIRRYEVGGREFFHIPRFRPHRQYLVRKVPSSPWDDERKQSSRRVFDRGLAKDQSLSGNLSTISLPFSSHMAEGVGVGVGEGVPPKPLDVRSADLRWTEFWASYPRKTAKQNARKAWAKIRSEEVDVILAALEVHKASEQWTRDGGRFIPHPATWLRGRRWEDEVVAGATIGQCMWNLNGSRGSAPRCEFDAVEERAGLRYCKMHLHAFGERVR